MALPIALIVNTILSKVSDGVQAVADGAKGYSGVEKEDEEKSSRTSAIRDMFSARDGKEMK